MSKFCNQTNQNPGFEFRILVVGFTHKSIDNLLKKLLEMIEKYKSFFQAVAFPIGRIVTEENVLTETSNVINQLKSSTKAVINFLKENRQCVVAGMFFHDQIRIDL